MNNWRDVFISSMQSFGDAFMRAIPDIIGAIILLIIGWIVAKIVSYAIGKIFKTIRFNKLSERVNAVEILEKANITTTPTQILQKFVFWIIMLFFIVTACETLGWSVVSHEISNIIRYLPSVLIALIILVVGIYIANLVKQIIFAACESLGISSSKLISGFAFYLILIMVIFTALNQAGVDISIITSNVSIIIAGLMFAFAISYGFASRDILSSILSSIYSKNKYAIGDIITIEDITGEIKSIDNISVTLLTDTEEIIIPGYELINKKVRKSIK